MKEKLNQIKDQALESWDSFSNSQKWTILGSFLFLLLLLILLVYWAQQTEFSPIYTNLSPAEAGEIMSTIESQGVPVQLSDDGTTVSVPKAEASRLKVELAHAGIPRSGNINYSLFSENMGLGMTDNQFEVLDRAAMQTELRHLIERIDGINQAQVMITMPSESVWLTDGGESATASVVLNKRPGLQLSQEQINGLYHLISKSVPQLDVDMIAIMDQNWQELAMADSSTTNNSLSQYQQQRTIKRDIERDIQRDLQRMLGTIIGRDKVVVSVFANVDFSQETREEHRVEPVDTENNEGIAISIERIQESFEGQGVPPGGGAGTGESDVANYPAIQGSGDSEYAMTEERINNEVNRIHRQIVMSPYLIQDLTINVGVEPPDPEDPDSLDVETVESIRDVLRSIVHTAGIDVPPEQLDDKISVIASPFLGRVEFPDDQLGMSNAVLYGLIAAAVILIGIVLFVFLRRRSSADEEDVEPFGNFAEEDDEPLETIHEDKKQKKMAKLAKENPKEFAKLLRSWMAGD